MGFIVPIYVLLQPDESESAQAHVVQQTDIYVAGAPIEQIE